MPTTEHIHLPLYTDEETPDLSTTGHYNHAMEILDANIGELEAEDAELAEGIADEREARIAGDSALDARIDNAETEISANSADLTGIKGLTYGTQHVSFVESSNGEYSSPALEEIAEQISQGLMVLKITTAQTSIDAEELAKVNANWPNVILMIEDRLNYTTGGGFMYPLAKTSGIYYFASPQIRNISNSQPYVPQATITINEGKTTVSVLAQEPTYWAQIAHKPFSTIGTGLKVVSDALTVDTSALPSGLTPIAVSETSTAADVYAKAQAAWPNCMLSGDTLYYPYAELPAVGSQTHAYLFTASGGGATSVWIVDAASITHESDIMATANATFGDFTKAVTA